MNTNKTAWDEYANIGLNPPTDPKDKVAINLWLVSLVITKDTNILFPIFRDTPNEMLKTILEMYGMKGAGRYAAQVLCEKEEKYFVNNPPNSKDPPIRRFIDFLVLYDKSGNYPHPQRSKSPECINTQECVNQRQSILQSQDQTFLQLVRDEIQQSAQTAFEKWKIENIARTAVRKLHRLLLKLLGTETALMEESYRNSMTTTELENLKKSEIILWEIEAMLQNI